MIERFGTKRIQAPGIFQAPAKAELIEASRDLVVLRVGCVRVLCDRPQLKISDILTLGIPATFASDSFSEQATYPEADDSVGQQVFFEERVEHGG